MFVVPQEPKVDSYCDTPLFKKAFHLYHDRGYDASTAFDMAKEKYFDTPSDPKAIEAALAEMNDEMPGYDEWRANKDKPAKKSSHKRSTKGSSVNGSSVKGSSDEKQLVLYKGGE